MQDRVRATVGAVLATVAMSIALPLSSYAEVVNEDELADRIAMVRTLLFESSAARRVASSDQPDAQEKRTEAIVREGPRARRFRGT